MTTPDAPEHSSSVATAEPRSTPDAVLAAAVEVARAAAVDVGGDAVGEHLGVRATEVDRVATHAFAAALPGYVGWYWAVTVARVSRSKTVTVDEVVLLPGDGALRPPPWVPWEERVRPGDLSPGDLLPARRRTTRASCRVTSCPTTRRSRPWPSSSGWVASGCCRARAGCWPPSGGTTSDRGPDTPMARNAPAHCGTCGFYLPLAGSLQAAFGVCGNEITDSDGQVVSVEYGCGAHSQVAVETSAVAEPAELVYDDGEEISAD